MVGKLKIVKPKDDLSFSNGFEFKNDEKKEQEEELEYFSCECDVIDGNTMESLSCYNFFNIVYEKYGLKKITLALNYDSMDNEFDDDVHEWIYNSSFLLKKAVNVFGDEILPKKDFYFELINDSGKKITVLFGDSYLISKNSDLITIGVQITKLID
jgi:hypothetical protein